MQIRDFLNLTASSLIAHRMRSFLTGLGIAVGIAAVVLLTSIGEGVHQFVLSEFTQFGTTLVGINPGKATTSGTSMGVFGTERPLTIEDLCHLYRVMLKWRQIIVAGVPRFMVLVRKCQKLSVCGSSQDVFYPRIIHSHPVLLWYLAVN
jgi:hypothetical protein